MKVLLFVLSILYGKTSAYRLMGYRDAGYYVKQQHKYAWLRLDYDEDSDEAWFYTGPYARHKDIFITGYMMSGEVGWSVVFLAEKPNNHQPPIKPIKFN